MSQHKELEAYREQMRQCVKCGTCRAHCPVFTELGKEAAVARGKISLAQALLDGDIDMDRRLVADISRCLACGRCVKECPNLVPTDAIVLAARRQIARRKGLSWFGRGVSTVLRRPRLMQWLARLGSAMSFLALRRVPRGSGLRLRFPAPFIDPERTLPAPAKRPFRSRHPELLPGAPGKPTVAFFTGCMINYVYPEIGEAVLACLQALGFSVVIPKGQGCCGLPALCAGDGATAAQLADRNLAALSRPAPDFIVTACASCHSGLTQYFAELGSEHEGLAEKVMDIHTLLVEQGLAERLEKLPRRETCRTVTYHIPCHLRQPRWVKAPQQLLAALPGVRFVPMANADACCGLGGTFSVYHYDTSRQIGARKAAGIQASGAELVATACPGCIVQLQDSLNHAGLPQKAVHVLELVAEALPELTAANPGARG